jgi:hypothetical protein
VTDRRRSTSSWRRTVCFKHADGKLNRFELHISKDMAELYASDAGVPSSLRP